MTRKYDISGKFDLVDQEKYAWLKKNLSGDQFVISDDGFLISSYKVSFTDPAAELMYVLMWS